ncbi:hypothetical protein E2562_002769 [Oryza meyeriana var. granulata]|uniref:Uncharacterized protein n=1 Tax=Oryza meyeriana var. granulata TaxID=110450 RepID=A0A6G1BQZ5_9ORYZ|nr:hypothetical protein E2562_002769 [Oryza meyeriana var. granulata]
MASMIAGDLVEVYVLKKACKEKMKAEANTGEAAAAVTGKKTAGGGSSEKKTSPEVSKGERWGFSGLLKKKVHPK